MADRGSDMQNATADAIRRCAGIGLAALASTNALNQPRRLVPSEKYSSFPWEKPHATAPKGLIPSLLPQTFVPKYFRGSTHGKCRTKPAADAGEPRNADGRTAAALLAA